MWGVLLVLVVVGVSIVVSASVPVFVWSVGSVFVWMMAAVVVRVVVACWVGRWSCWARFWYRRVWMS